MSRIISLASRRLVHPRVADGYGNGIESACTNEFEAEPGAGPAAEPGRALVAEPGRASAAEPGRALVAEPGRALVAEVAYGRAPALKDREFAPVEVLP